MALAATSVLLLCAAGLTADGRAAQASAASRDSPRSTLEWGHHARARRSQHSALENRGTPRRTRLIRDARVVAAAWEADDIAAGEQSLAEAPRLVVERSTPVYDPFDEDDSLAQLPDDPFDEPADDSMPVPEDEPAEDIDAVEDALEQEIERRQSASERFGEAAEEMEDRLESDALEPESLDDADETDLFGPYRKDSEQDNDDARLQLDKQDPDSALDFDRDYQFGGDEPTAEELDERKQALAREQRESQESCREELEEIAADRISSIDLSIRVDGNAGEDFPYECAVSTKRHRPRQWSQITYNWKASALCHKPLYFEQVQLERYGHCWGPYSQPIMSGVHFFGTIPLLPYKMGIRTPTECVYALGYYRPGSCAPYLIDPVPFTWRAALFQAGAVTGVAAVIP